MSKRILSRVLSPLLILAVAFPVFAATMIQQLVKTDEVINETTSNVNFQNLGNGLSGHPETLVLNGKVDAGTPDTRVQVNCYTDAGYTITCPEAAFNDHYFGYVGTAPAGSYTGSITTTQSDRSFTMGSTTFQFSPSRYYQLSPEINAITTQHFWGNSTGSGGINFTGALFYIIYDDAGVNTATRIDVVVPADDETIATSTTASFSATGYVNSADYLDGTYLEIRYAPYSAGQSATANPDLLFTTLALPISSSGDFIVSTTSPVLTKGLYTMQTQIKTGSWVNSVLNFLGFGQFANVGILSATSTQFTAVELSAFDIFVASSTESINAYIASSTVSLSACTAWTSFSLGECLNLLFVPQPQPISEALSNFKNGFLQYAPWGYLTRTVVILSGTATSTIPDFSFMYTLDGPTDVHTFTLDTDEMLAGAGAILDDITEPYSGFNYTVRDVFEPIVQLFIAALVVLTIFHDLMGVGHQAVNSRRRGQV